MRFRVHFHRWAAGGGLTPTWREVEADDQAHSVAVAEQHDRAYYAALRRSWTGYFTNATAERIDDAR